MPFPIRVHAEEPDLSDSQKRRVLEVKRQIRQLHEDRLRAEAAVVIYARQVHQEQKVMFQDDPESLAILAETERLCPWLVQTSGDTDGKLGSVRPRVPGHG